MAWQLLKKLTMDKPNTASATDSLDATAPAAAPETIETDTLVTATGGFWGGPYAYAVPAWGPVYRPVFAAPAWGPYAWGPRPHWWR